MRQATPDTTRRACGTRGLALLATLILAGFFAAPAQAGGNEFDDGFEDQLGRLVATEVFHLGKWMLAGAPTYVHYGHETHERRHYRHSRYDRRARGHARGHYKHHKRHHRKHYGKRGHYWRMHYGHDHVYEAPCNVETHERVRRNRRGEVVEYERHERRTHDRYARH